MKKCFLLMIAVMMFYSCSQKVQENAQWRGENRDGVYHETGLLKEWAAGGPQLLWSFEGLGEGFSSVAVANGKAYVAGMPDDDDLVLFVFDLSGKLLNRKVVGKEWNTSFPGSRCSPLIHEGKLYLGNSLGQLFCLDEATLDEIWKIDAIRDFDGRNIMFGVTENPLIVGDKIFWTPGGVNNNMLALNKDTGELIWSSTGTGTLSTYCSPMFIDGYSVPMVITYMAAEQQQDMGGPGGGFGGPPPGAPGPGGQGGRPGGLGGGGGPGGGPPAARPMQENKLVAFNANTGEVIWTHTQPSGNTINPNTPIYSNGHIFTSTGYGGGSWLLRLIDGGRNVEQVWHNIADNQHHGPVKVGDYVYTTAQTNRGFHCINWKTGETMFRENNHAQGVLIYADGMIYCYDDRGFVSLIKPTTDRFEVVSSFEITLGTNQHWAHPVIRDGVLYIRHGDALMAYKIK